MARVQSHSSLLLRAGCLLPLLLLLRPPPAQAGQTRQPAAAPRQDDAHHDYAVPAPFIEALAPRGLRISIPDEAGIAQVRFHLGVNKPLSAQRLGTVNVEVSHRTGAVWTYEDRTTVLRAPDVLHYWLLVTRHGHEYEREGRHTVQDLVETYNVGLSTPLSAPAAPPPPRQPPPPQPPQPPPCTRSQTSVNGRLVCRGELVFLENFDDLATGPWRHDVHLAGPPDYEFTAFTQSPANTYAVNGQLVVRPTLTDDVYGRDFVRTGRLQLDNCTAGAADSEQCSRQARYGYILPPVLSGRISTRKSFSFRYGLLEIRAKLPSGDWIYPELWLLPREEAYGPGLKSGRVQVALARGNADLHLGGTELGLRRLEAGALAATGLGASPDSHDPDDDDDNAPNVVAFAAVPARATPSRSPPTTTTTTTTTTRRPPTTSARTTAASRGAATRPSGTTSSGRTGGGQPKTGTASTSRASTTAAPNARPVAASTVTGGNPVRSSGKVAPAGSSSGSPPARNGQTASPVRGHSQGSSQYSQGASQHSQGASQGYSQYSQAHGAPTHGAVPSRTTAAPPFVGFDDGGDSGGWPRSGRRSRAVSSGSAYKGPSRKEVSRTELPGRPWSSGFHNYTLHWTPDSMTFSVDGVELGVLDAADGLLRSATNPENDPWYGGSTLAPFDREFYISLGLAVGGIHNFPDGVEGPNRSKKPWKNTAAKAMLSFWNAKDDWYESWSTESALLVDSVRVTAL